MLRKDKTTGLNSFQEEYAAGLAAGMKQRDAYQQAYPRSKNWTVNAVDRNASVLAKKPEVERRVRELQAPARRAHEVTVEGVTRRLLEDREFARETKNAGAAVTATMGLAKLHGLLVEDRKNDRDPFSGWTAEDVSAAMTEVRAAIDRARASIADEGSSSGVPPGR